MKNKLKNLAIVVFAFLVMGCNGKKEAEFEAIKKDIVVLQKNWKLSQEELGISIENMKTDLNGFEKTESDLTKLVAARKGDAKREAETKLSEAKVALDTLRQEMTKLNAYIKEWNQQSKVLNQMVKDVGAKTIEPENAREQIAALRTFKAQVDPKLKEIEVKLEAYHTNHQELDQYLAKFRKKK